MDYLLLLLLLRIRATPGLMNAEHRRIRATPGLMNAEHRRIRATPGLKNAEHRPSAQAEDGAHRLQLGLKPRAQLNINSEAGDRSA